MKPVPTSSIRNLSPALAPSLTRLASGLCLALSLAAYNAGAATIQWWDNNGTSAATGGNWDSTSDNWASSSALTASTATFGSGNVAAFAAGTNALSSLTISIPSGAVTCSGISNATTGAGITGSLTFNGAGSITLASGADGFYCGSNSAANMIVNTPITGAGEIVQHGSGSLYLNGANTYSGGTSLTGGQIIYYNNNSSFGVGPITNGAASGAIVNNTLPAAALTITNNFVFPGAFSLNIVGGIAVGGLPGTTFTGNFLLTTVNTTINTGNSATYVAEITGAISGAGSPIVADDGTLELGGVNTYLGNTTISSPATLAIVGSGSLGGGSYAGSITNNYTFNYGSSASQTLSGVISGSGWLTQNGTGQLTLTAANTYTGGTTNASGTLVIKGAGVIPGNVTVTGGTLDAQTANSLPGTPGSISGNNFTVTGGTLELDNPTAISSGQFAALSLPASGANSMFLNFSGTCSVLSLNFGGTPAADGTWGAAGSGATYTNAAFTGSGILNVAVSTGTVFYWDANHSDAFPGSGGNGNWDNSTADWWVSGSTDTAWQPGDAANFGGTPGTVTVDATVAPGSLVFAIPNYVVTNSGSATIYVTNPATLISVPAGATTIGSPITGQGLAVSGPGTLVLSGTNTYSFGTIVTNQATVSVSAIADSGTSGIGTGPLTFGGGTLSYTGSVTSGSGTNATTARTITATGNTTATINVPVGDTLTLNGQVHQISDTAPEALTFTGGGTLNLGGTLDNSSLYMAISAGKVVITKSSASSAHGLGGGTSTIASGAELQLAGAGGYDLYSGTALVMAGGGMLDLNGQSDNTGTLNLSGAGISGAGALINSSATASFLTNSSVALAGNTTVGGVGPITWAGVISGEAVLTQADSSTLTLVSANTFYGGLNINPGATVQVENASGAGDGPITMDANSSLQVNIGSATILNQIIGGPSTSVNVLMTLTNATLSINSDLSQFTGTLNIPADPGNPNTSEVQFYYTEAEHINPAATINVTNGGTLAVVNHNVIVPCTLNLFGAGNSTQWGQLRIEAGSLISGPVNLYGNATIGNSQSGATVQSTISGVISSPTGTYGPTFTVEPGIIQIMGANTYTGPTTLNGCILQLDSAETPGTGGPLGNPATPAGSIVMNGGQLQFSSVNTHDYSSRFSAAASQKFYFDVNGQTVTLATPLASSGGVLGVQSSIPGGVLVLSGANTFTGPTTNASGIIRLAVAENPGTSGPLGDSPAVLSRNTSATLNGGIDMAGGTLQYTPANSGDYSGRFLTNSSQAFNIDVNGQNVSYANALLSSGGTLTLSSSTVGGSLTLNSTNAYTGATTINPGATLIIGGTGCLRNTNGAVVYFAAINDEGTLNYGSSSNQLLGGAITGNGSLVVSGTGTLILTNPANAYFGGTTISKGALMITNTSSILGNVAVAGGQLVLGGVTNLAPSAVLSVTNSAAGAVDLNYSGVETISGLVIGVTNMPAGTYGAVGNASVAYTNAAFIGAGILNVAGQVAYWDPSPSLDAFPGSGGSGSWDNGTSDWWVSGNTDSVWAGTNTAYFAGPAGTVSVNANVTASGLSFIATNYTIGGGSTLTLLDYTNTGTPIISIPSGNTTISCPLATAVTTNAVIINGPGTLTLSADNSGASGITNNLEVTGGGTLSVNTIEDGGFGPSAIGNAANLELLNGNLAFTGASGQTARHITATGPFTNAISVLPGNTLELDGIVQNIGGTGSQQLALNGGGTLIFGGYQNDNSGLDVAINNGTLIISKTTYASAHGLGGGTSTIGSNGVLQLNGPGNYDLYSGCILSIASGGMLDVNGQIEVSSSTLTMLGAGSNNIGALINSSYGPAYFTNTGIVLAGNTLIGGNGNITLPAVISGLGASLTYSNSPGSGAELLLGGANTFTGPLIVAPGGTVGLQGANSAGSGPIILQSGGAGGAGSGGTLDLPTAGNTYGSSYYNPVTGDSTTSIYFIGTGTGNQFSDYELTGFQGTIYCGNGGNSVPQVLFTAVIEQEYPVNSNATFYINNGATLDFQAPCNVNPANVIVNGIGNNIYGSLRLDAATQAGPVLLNGSNCQIGDGNTPVGASTISGVISDGGYNYGFTKVGAVGNIIILTGVNTYGGPTVVSNGILAISGSGSIASSCGLTLDGSTTFDVSGVPGGYSLLGSQTLTNLGSAIIGGSLTLSAGTSLALQCTNIGTALTVTNGTLTLNNNPINFTAYNSLGNQISPLPGTYPLIATTVGNTGAGQGFVAGSVASSSLNVIGLNPAFNASLAISNNALYLIIGVTTPTIIGQLPISAGGPATLLYAGGNPQFSVQAEGLAPLQYLWYTNNVLVGYATSASLTLTNVQVPLGQQSGTLSTYCVVSNTSSYTPAVSATWTANVTNDPTAPYPALVLAAHPLGYWRLDEPDNQLGDGEAGVIAEDYLGNNDGVYTNLTLGVSGYTSSDNPNTDPSETCVSVTGAANSDAYAIPNINFGSPAGTTPTFSVEAWVSGSSQIVDAGIVSLGYGGGGEEFDLDTGSDSLASHGFRFFVRDASGNTHASSSSTTPTSGSWFHLVGVCDESNGVVSLYVNGILATSGSGSISPGSGILSSVRNMIIGARPSNSTTQANNLQFQGDIEDVAVYNYALTSSEVISQYVSVDVPPTFSQAPPTTVNLDAGQSLVLPATALGTPPLLYVWADVLGGTNLSSGVTNGNVISASQTVSNVPASWNGDILSLTVSNAYGQTSIQIALNVASFLQASLLVSTNNLSLIEGTTYTLTAAAAGSVPITFQWFSNSVPVTGATSDTFTAVAALGSTAYSCVVSNQSGVTNLSLTLTGVPYLTLNWNGIGWMANQVGTTFTSTSFNNNGTLELTDNGGSEARSAFFQYPQYIGAFEASYTYLATGNAAADGATFCIQNATNAAAAIGSGGGGLGIEGLTPSVEIEFNLYNNYDGTGTIGGSALETDGTVPSSYPMQGAGGLNLKNGDPISVSIDYASGNMAITFMDTVTSAAFSTNWMVNVTQVVGTNNAYVGFTGADGGSVAIQTISNFSFLSLMDLEAQISGTSLILSWPNDISLYQLQSATSLSAPVWVNVNTPVTVINNMNEVTVPATGAQAFYRLILQ